MKTTYTWLNTNILLRRANCYGLKTGLTPNAGACLVVLFDLMRLDHKRPHSSVRRNDLEGYILVTLLGSKDQSKRFSEAEKLINWFDSC
jgi:D-alanyl-D-alanine carboxypeptidase